MRLIDADALMGYLKRCVLPDSMTYTLAIDIAETLLNNAPTIDAVPVVRGEWIQKITATGKPYDTCSKCETTFVFKAKNGSFEIIDVNDFNYCPNCGCDMRGESNGKE